MPPSKIKVSDLVVQLALGLALSLRLARQGKVSEVILGALGVRSEQLRFLGVQEGEGLGARPVRLHTHLDSFNFRFTKQFRRLSQDERNTRGRCLLKIGIWDRRSDSEFEPQQKCNRSEPRRLRQVQQRR